LSKTRKGPNGSHGKIDKYLKEKNLVGTLFSKMKKFFREEKNEAENKGMETKSMMKKMIIEKACDKKSRQ